MMESPLENIKPLVDEMIRLVVPPESKEPVEIIEWLKEVITGARELEDCFRQVANMAEQTLTSLVVLKQSFDSWDFDESN